MEAPRKTAWSWYRDRMFSFCPRAYSLHYYDGRGGHDPYAERDRRLIYRLKKLSGIPMWLDTIMSEAIRACVPWRRKEFQVELFRLFRTGRNQVMGERWLDDPAFLNLAEIYYETDDPERLFVEAQQELKRRCSLLDESPLPELFRDLSELSVVKAEYPLTVDINTVEAWTAPVQVWRSDGQLYFLNRLNPEAEAVAGALQCVWAMRYLKTPPERIYFAAYDFADGSYREYPAKELEISQALQRIEARAGEFYTSDFAGNRENCGNCRFREYCQTV